MNTRKCCWIAGAVLVLLVVGINSAHGQVGPSLASLGLFLFLCVTALPITRLLFRNRLAALVFAFPTGYVLHAVLLSVLASFLGVRPLTLCIDTALAIALVLALRKRESAQELWDSSELLLLLCWLVVALMMTAPAFLNVGTETSSGFAYRAYFNADFFRNMAVSGSLAHTGIPPVNPYFSERILHYYWFFHLLPAFWEKTFPSWRLDFILVQFSVFGVLTFVAALYIAVRSFVSQRKTMLLLLPVFALGGSYEGLYVLQQLREKHQPWEAFTQVNIDGILRWNWNAPQIDTLYRALLYAPQHLIALAILLMMLHLRKSLNGNLAGRPGLIAIVCLLIFSTLGFSVFVGAILILGVGVEWFLKFVRNPAGNWKELAIFAAIALVFLGFYHSVFQMFEAGSTPIKFGLDPAVAHHLFAYILLNWGALVLIGFAGVFLHPRELPARPLLFLLALCAFLVFFVELILPGFSDISLKMGHLSHVLLLCFAAGFLDRLLVSYPNRYKSILAGVLILVLPASITWAMDAYNSRDILNKKFTTHISKDDADLFEWMSRNLPHSTTIQNFSLNYEGLLRDFVSAAPPFAQRPVYLGDRIFSRIFQIPEKEVEERRKVMSLLFRETDPARVAEVSRYAGIEYLFVETKDAPRLSEIEKRLATPYFSPLFQSGDAWLFRVNP